MTPPVYPAFVEAAFARFMADYPDRPVNPRAPAKAMFARLVREGEDPEFLIRAAGLYARDMKAAAVRPTFIPHARTWLSQRIFDDYRDAADVPAPADEAQPAPEHPMAGHPMDWARAHVTPGAWTSWFSRLSVEMAPPGVVRPTLITAPTAFARDRVQQEYGHLIRRQFGTVQWRIEGEAS